MLKTHTRNPSWIAIRLKMYKRFLLAILSTTTSNEKQERRRLNTSSYLCPIWLCAHCSMKFRYYGFLLNRIAIWRYWKLHINKWRLIDWSDDNDLSRCVVEICWMKENLFCQEIQLFATFFWKRFFTSFSSETHNFRKALVNHQNWFIFHQVNTRKQYKSYLWSLFRVYEGNFCALATLSSKLQSVPPRLRQVSQTRCLWDKEMFL